VALSAFDDPLRAPTHEELATTLGPAARLWFELIAETGRLTDGVTEAWTFTSAKNGWSMRLVRGTRVLVYMTPQAGALLVGVVLGEKAIGSATEADAVSKRTLEVLAAAPRYAEGRGVRIHVRTEDDLAVANDLVRIKVGR
jgi:hypothetical protein